MSHVRIRTVAFIGTGIMGEPIARHILDAGYHLVVNNRTKAKADTLVAAGATWASSPSEAARDADVVFTMLGFPDEVEDVYLATDGLLRATKKGAYLIDLTTSSPQLARDIHDAAEIDDKHAFDCPVTGGQAGAQNGTLTLIIGESKTTVAPVLPLLKTFSSRIFYFDGAGKGQLAKLANQVSLAACMVGYADAMALAEQGGLDVSKALDMIGHGMGGSVALSQLAPRSLKGDYKPGFMAEHLRKDLKLALSSSEDLDITLPGAETAFALYDMLCQIGGSHMGTQAITLLYADQATGEAAGINWALLDKDEQGDEEHHNHDGCSDDHDGNSVGEQSRHHEGKDA
jgi:3-hydroxyisobutyrate dehydrogenase